MHNKYTVRFKCARPAAFICSGLLLFTAACSRTTNKYGIGGDHGKEKELNGFNVETWPVAHMVAQIRGKELATRDSQDKLIAAFKDWHDANPRWDLVLIEGTLLVYLTELSLTSADVNKAIKDLGPYAFNDVGFPIQYNRNLEQLQIAIKWIEAKQQQKLGSSIESILNGKLLHDLPNKVPLDEIPTLKSPSDKNFWGNENASTSSILLAIIDQIFTHRNNDKLDAIIAHYKKNKLYPRLFGLDKAAISAAPLPGMAGASMRFPFYKDTFKLETPSNDYPLAFEGPKGWMWTYGGFQFGGHRYLPKQFILGPEDASSAAAKAIYLKGTEFKAFTTESINIAFDNPDDPKKNPYEFKPVAAFKDEIDPKLLTKILPGQILGTKGFAAIVAKNYGNGWIGTLQFNRELTPKKPEENKMEGGGYYSYDLYEEIKNRPRIFFLDTTKTVEKHSGKGPFGHSYTLPDFIKIIDEGYKNVFPEGPKYTEGDSSIFFEGKKEDKEDRKCCTIG